jgi:uncharacterized protein (TIGR03382 family)
VRFAVVVIIALSAHAARATPPEPSGKHPRILLDGELRDAWRAQAKLAHGPVPGAIALCDDAARGHAHDRGVYQGSEWRSVLQACLVAWAATDDDAHAKTAIRFFTAMLDDYDEIGDGKGGDAAARRDSGYAIRNIAPYGAIAYDWLHDRLPEELRARARARWKAWLAWYRASGYRARAPGTNYHAGFAISATLVAIAQAGEAGEDGAAEWRAVADDLWAHDMAAALAPGGILDGGDWAEGWQYGPFSVAEYALAARAARGAGIDVANVSAWLAALLRRHVHGLSPSDGVFVGGDTEATTPNQQPNVLTLDAIALGDAPPDERRWARGELSRLRLVDREFFLYDALAAVGDKPVVVPRASWPTWHVADATGTLYARTRWDDRAMWIVVACKGHVEADHRHPDAGNFVVSRGKDDVIVDPSPYGSASTLTSNAPTVASGQLPKDYIPSQAFWSTRTGFDWATQRASGAVLARCEYADQYKFQERRSDIPDARRDVVMIPNGDGTSGVVFVVDAANTNDGDRGMFLRFRTPGTLALDGDRATATVGASKLQIASVARSGGTPALGDSFVKDCFGKGTVRGRCDAARFPVTELRVELGGPRPRATHALSIGGKDAAPATFVAIGGDDWAGVRATGMRDAVVVWPTKDGEKPLSYAVPAGANVVHAILDLQMPTASVTARRDGDRCAVDVAPGGDLDTRPLVVALDAACKVTPDPELPRTGAGPHRAPAIDRARSPRSGCCGAQTTPDSPIAMTVVVALVARRRRRR